VELTFAVELCGGWQELASILDMDETDFRKS
jgi:hypothetical protein